MASEHIEYTSGDTDPIYDAFMVLLVEDKYGHAQNFS